VRVFNRHGVDKDQRAMSIERAEEERLAEDRDDELSILERNIFSRLAEILLNKTAASGPKGMAADTKITQSVLDTIAKHQWWQIGFATKRRWPVKACVNGMTSPSRLDNVSPTRSAVAATGDAGRDEDGRVFVAVKRKLRPGDKMAAVSSKGGVQPHRADRGMPHLEGGADGRSGAHPLGVPPHECQPDPGSHLGWACSGLSSR
jgi:DNA-directed RNA polymerase subunit beta